MTLAHRIRKWLWKRGVDVSRVTPAGNAKARRGALLRAHGIDRVLDVGANEGQYALELREDLAFRGAILSFEPVPAAYRRLREQAAADPLWETFPFALGETAGTAVIHVAGNSVSSSLMPMLPSHLAAAPRSRTVRDETIEIRTLDSLPEEACPPGARTWLKIDAQGAEAAILRGAERTLTRVAVIQLELSLVPLYEGAPLIEDLFRLLREKGFVPVSLEPGFADPATGCLLQADGVFARPAPAGSGSPPP